MLAVLMDIFEHLMPVAYFVMLPILVLMGLGYLLQSRMGMDMPTLTRLNFHFIVPAVIYGFVVTSPVTMGDVVVIVGYELVLMALLTGLAVAVAMARRLPEDQRRVLIMAAIFHNSGNYGIPMQQLAFRGPYEATAVSFQVFILLVQNVVSFTLGVFLAGRKVQFTQAMLTMVRFPPLWALVAALATIAVREQMSAEQTEHWQHLLSPFWQIIEYIREAFVAVALCTLGAQLATVRATAMRYPITLSVVLRLLVSPALALMIIYLFGIRGLMAQVLLISSVTPTSVNALLLCLHFGNHPDFIARSVFYSTVLSPIAVALVILLARSEVLPGFGM